MTEEQPVRRVGGSGHEVEVRLPESPATGYRWHLDDPSVGVTVLEATYEDHAAARVAGGTGTRVFRLHLADDAGGEILFLLRRPWEPPDSAIERRQVRVHPDS